MAFKTYKLQTFGCQMNAHDSERIAGALVQDGYIEANAEDAEKDNVDLVVLNTCAVRENADNKLYGHLGQLAEKKRLRPDMQIAVGGCLAQKDKGDIIKKAPWVDVVFGTHNMASLPVLLRRARHNKKAEVEIYETLQAFPSLMPSKRESFASGWVSISVGCNNTCTFCIVPKLRGKQRDRRPGDILSEIKALVDEGASEITLLGQNVNSYGIDFADRKAFGKLLRACGNIKGLKRVRFTSPHPSMFKEDVIEAMAETQNIMPQIHMPLQSGSDEILKAMRRPYRSQKFLSIIEAIRDKIPDIAISTDIIVGFPGESEEDFQKTLDIVQDARFASAFTFQYSKRPDTPAAYMPGQIPKEVVQYRYERLIALQNDISYFENKARLGKQETVLVSSISPKGADSNNSSAPQELSEIITLTGRTAHNRLMHILAKKSDNIRPGDYIKTRVTSAKSFYIRGDSLIYDRIKTKAGDAYEASLLTTSLDSQKSSATKIAGLSIPIKPKKLLKPAGVQS